MLSKAHIMKKTIVSLIGRIAMATPAIAAVIGDEITFAKGFETIYQAALNRSGTAG